MQRYGLLAIFVAALSLLATLSSSQPAFAAFHLIRIHAVMAGLNGDNTIQFVELRMCAVGQPFVATHTLKFYDSAGALKATFTFPSSVSNSSLGESILIATAEYNTASVGPGMGGSGGDADFVFSMANTAGSNGGDPLHPVQDINGKVRFADQQSDGCDTNITNTVGDADSVAYGTATADFVSAAPALPSPSDNQALRESNLAGPTNNSTDYSLQVMSTVSKTVAAANLPTDLDTPRNNAREVANLGSNDIDGDGVPNGPDLCEGTATGATVDANGCSNAQVDGDGDGVCNPGAPSGGPAGCTGSDNCPSTANPSQANADGDAPGNACDTEGPPGNTNGFGGGDDCADAVDNDGDTLVDFGDPGCNTTDTDADGVFDVVDNCPTVRNAGQEDFDGDSQGNACDADDDDDGYSDDFEAGTPVCAGSVNDDNNGMTIIDDTATNDGCPALGAAEADCNDTATTGLPLDDDSDGANNDGCPPAGAFSEGAFHIGTGTLAPCNVGAVPNPSPSWPSDLISGGIPSSTDRITIIDVLSFVSPTRQLDTSPGNPLFSSRYDLVPGRGAVLNWINIADVLALVAGSSGNPPMFGGARAFGNPGPACSGP